VGACDRPVPAQEKLKLYSLMHSVSGIRPSTNS
jgi:hypothetical protein